MCILFQISKIIKKGDYLYALVPSHPNATKNGYVLLHRVIVENEVDRLLTSEEVVHHINHNPYDCRLCNLKLMTKEAHRILHEKEKESLYAIIVCPECKNVFIKKIWKGYFDSIKTHNCIFCSRSCNGKHARKLQLGKLQRVEKIEDQVISVGYATKEEYLKRINENDFSELRKERKFPLVHLHTIVLDERNYNIIDNKSEIICIA